MSPLLSLLMSVVGDKVEDRMSRHAATAGFLLIAALFFFMALVAGIAALTVWLAKHIDLWAALAIVALGLLGAAGVTMGIGAIRALSSENKAKEDSRLSQDALLGVLSSFGAGGKQANSRTLLIAALVGLLAGSALFDGKPPKGKS